MVDSFDVSFSSSFIRKKRQQERECGFYIYNPGGAMRERTKELFDLPIVAYKRPKNLRDLDHLDQPVTKTLPMAHASVGRHDARRVPWFKI